MINDLLTLQSCNLDESNFISEEQYWSDGNGEICLTFCEFCSARYTQKSFLELEVSFFPELDRAVVKRQAEFLAGRYAAKQVILKSGFLNGEVPPIQIGDHRSPIWPPGIIGSITHNHSKAICAIIKDDKSAYIGIDLEEQISTRTASNIEELVLKDSEKKILTQQGASDALAITIIFSAKESLFKALYPIIKIYFGFELAQVMSADLRKGTLTLELESSIREKMGINSSYLCNFHIGQKKVFTMVTSLNLGD